MDQRQDEQQHHPIHEKRCKKGNHQQICLPRKFGVWSKHKILFKYVIQMKAIVISPDWMSVGKKCKKKWIPRMYWVTELPFDVIYSLIRQKQNLKKK